MPSMRTAQKHMRNRSAQLEKKKNGQSSKTD